MVMGEDECAPVNQLDSIHTYSDCCTVQDASSTIRYTIEGKDQCTLCGKRTNNSMYTLQVMMVPCVYNTCMCRSCTEGITLLSRVINSR